MLNSIDEGVLEALWNTATQDFEQIISRSPNTDVISVLEIKDDGERETSVYLPDIDSKGARRLIKCHSTQLPEDRDVKKAAEYFIST